MGGDNQTSDHLTKGREKITREMVADASRLLPEFGIELLDIRIKRINYVESVQQKVFDRMISERKRIAAQIPFGRRGGKGCHFGSNGSRNGQNHLGGLPEIARNPGQSRCRSHPDLC